MEKGAEGSGQHNGSGGQESRLNLHCTYIIFNWGWGSALQDVTLFSSSAMQWIERRVSKTQKTQLIEGNELVLVQFIQLMFCDVSP